MIPPFRPALSRALIAAGFLLQGLILASRGESGSGVAVAIFGAFALGALAGVRSLQGLISASAALGGLGMAAGEWLQGFGHSMAHHSLAETAGIAEMAAMAATTDRPAILLSWSGLLMILGCTAACTLLPGTHRTARQWFLHHGATLAGMCLGMIVPHAVVEHGGFSAPDWVLHLTMVAAMACAGRLALALARALDRRLLVAD